MAGAERRVIEFFTAHIRNPHTRKPTPGLQPASPPGAKPTTSPLPFHSLFRYY